MPVAIFRPSTDQYLCTTNALPNWGKLPKTRFTNSLLVLADADAADEYMEDSHIEFTDEDVIVDIAFRVIR